MDENINVHVYLYIYTCACVCVHILQWIPTLDGESTIIQLPSSNQTWLSGQSASIIVIQMGQCHPTE